MKTPILDKAVTPDQLKALLKAHESAGRRIAC